MGGLISRNLYFIAIAEVIQFTMPQMDELHSLRNNYV